MTPLWRRALIAWVCMAVAATANGIFREVVLRRFLTQRGADIASALLAIVLLQFIAFLALHKSSPSRSELAAVAAVWLVMTVAFEFALGRTIDHKTWSELLENYNVLDGKLWPIVLASVVAAPFIVSRRSAEKPAAPLG